MSSPRRRTLLLALAVLAACASKKNAELEDPDAEAAPSSFAPSEEFEPSGGSVAADPYAGMSEEERTTKARELYAEAEKFAKSADWENAALKYEEAYHLVPGKHGFAFKVGTAAHKAGDCDKAESYLHHFNNYADPNKHAKQIKQAKAILAKTAGCGGSLGGG